MQRSRPLEPLAIHAQPWSVLDTYIQSKTIPHAFFWSGPRHAELIVLAHAFMAALMCTEQNTPCGKCTFCVSLSSGTCPDLHEVRLESGSTVIKIDQIRALHPAIDQSPQRGSHRFVLIEPADMLNAAAANALLKVLEEPPDRTFFILISEQMTGLPLTLLSRCQRHVFGSSGHIRTAGQRNYLGLGQLQPPDSIRSLLCDTSGTVMALLLELLNRQITASAVAASLSAYPLDEVLWFLYLLIAQAIYDNLLDYLSSNSQQVIKKIRELPPEKLFAQLTNLVSWMKAARDDTRLNQTLVLEVFLLDLVAVNNKSIGV